MRDAQWYLYNCLVGPDVASWRPLRQRFDQTGRRDLDQGRALDRHGPDLSR